MKKYTVKLTDIKWSEDRPMAIINHPNKAYLAFHTHESLPTDIEEFELNTEFDPTEKKASWCKFSDYELFLADLFSTMADEYGYFVDSVADIEITEG